jgi:O-antigen/teichoic acid export membrane protein
VSRSPAIDSAPACGAESCSRPRGASNPEELRRDPRLQGHLNATRAGPSRRSEPFPARISRGTFVLVVLSVTILARLLGQLGYAVTNRMQRRRLELRQLVHAAFAVVAVLGAGGIAVIIGWGALTPDVGATVAAIAACALVPAVWQSISGVLRGLGRVRLWNVIQTLPPVGTFIGMLVLVVGLHGGVRGAVLAWTLAHILTALFSLTATRGIWMPLPLSRLLDLFNVELARLALTMGAVQVVNLISYRIELFVLDRYRGIRRVGVYSIAVQTVEILWLVAGAIAAAVTAPTLQKTSSKRLRSSPAPPSNRSPTRQLSPSSLGRLRPS